MFRKIRNRTNASWLRYGLIAMVTALVIAPVAVYAADSFDDVPDTNIFHDDIQWMADNAITAGCGGNNFCPSANVTREQMSAFMKRLAVNQVVDAATALEADHAADAGTLEGIDAAGFVEEGETDSISTGMLVDGAATTDKVATAGFEVEGAPGAITIPGSFDETTDIAACVAGPYTPDTDQVGLMHISMSASDGAQQTMTAFPLLSDDGGTTWSRAFWGFFAPASNPAGGWALSARSDEMELTAGTTYSFAIGYESLGADYTADATRCHLSVTMVAAGGGGTFGLSLGAGSEAAPGNDN